LEVGELAAQLGLDTEAYSAGVIASEVILPRNVRLKVTDRYEKSVPWGNANYGVVVQYCVVEIIP